MKVVSVDQGQLSLLLSVNLQVFITLLSNYPSSWPFAIWIESSIWTKDKNVFDRRMTEQ